MEGRDGRGEGGRVVGREVSGGRVVGREDGREGG